VAHRQGVDSTPNGDTPDEDANPFTDESTDGGNVLILLAVVVALRESSMPLR
jgi:hypothetical protein